MQDLRARLKSRLRRQDFWWLSGCLLLGAGLRVSLLQTSLTEISSDEAVPGLQARHIWLAGARPLVDYENPPHGSMEMYLTAGVFALFGSSALTLRLVPLAFGLAFVPLSYGLGRVARSASVGRWSALYAAIGPAFLEIWQLKAGSGYVIVLALGAASLLVLNGLAYRRWGVPAYALLGLLLGIGFWNHPVMIYFWVVSAVGIGLLVAGGVRDVGSRRPSVISKISGPAALAAGTGIGLAPLIAYNARNDWITFQILSRSEAALPNPILALKDVFAVAMPIMLGFAQPTSSADEAQRIVHEAGWMHGVGVAVGALLFAWTIWHFRESILSIVRLRLPPQAGSLMLVALVVTPVLFSLSRFRDFLTEPRYLMPIFVAMPLVVGVILGSSGRFRQIVGRAAIVAALVVNVVGVMRIDPALNLPWEEGVSLRNSNQELIAFLEDRQLDRFYADYWIVYPVMFESAERLLGYAVLDGIEIGWNRYIPAAHAVSVSEAPAVVQIAGTEAETRFRRLLSSRMIDHSEARVGAYTVYWGFSERILDF